MEEIYTIGFTKKSAKVFFELMKDRKIDIVLDVRLNNTSQLAGFSKYPDIEYFLDTICNIQYVSDVNFAPEDWVLKEYKAKNLTWDKYVSHFNDIMEKRNILQYIKDKYRGVEEKKICLLCSEEKPDNCHRFLVAQRFKKVFGCKIINL